jgi:BMFP domain-containing protein YqiC
MKTEKRQLMCDLTQEELITKGEEIVALYKANSELDMQKKRLSAAIKRNDEDIENLLNIVDNKSEQRDVDCSWIFFWEDGTKKLVRLDTFTVEEDDSQDEVAIRAREAAENSDAATTSDEPPSFCTNKECDSQDDTEPNGCTKLEYICECKEWGK